MYVCVYIYKGKPFEKIEIILFFLRIFFISINSAIRGIGSFQNYLNLAKMFVLKSVINLLVAEINIPEECIMCREKKIFV